MDNDPQTSFPMLHPPTPNLTLVNRVEHVTIHHLPSEILCKVFLCCTTSYAPIVYVPPISPRAMPWVITHVCSSWRKMSLNFPALWDHVTFKDPRRRDRGKAIIKLLQVVLSRSKERSLDLEIRGPPFPGLYYSSLDVYFANLIKNHGRRIRSLDIDFVNYNISNPWVQSFLALPAGTFESLEKVCLRDVDRPLKGPMLGGTPKLREVSFFQSREIFGTPDENYHRNLKLDWSNLTDLVFQYEITSFVAHTILNQCTCLIKCELTLEGNDYEPTTFSKSSILLPELSWLTVYFCHDITESEDEFDTLAEFCRPLSVPSLTYLHLQAPPSLSGSVAEEFMESFPELFMAPCSLQKLYLGGIIIDLAAAFKWMPLLSDCTTLECRLSEEALRLLDEGRVPLLEMLECSVRLQDMEKCIETLKKRWSQTSAERSFSDSEGEPDKGQIRILNLQVLEATDDETSAPAYENTLMDICQALRLRNVTVNVSPHE